MVQDQNASLAYVRRLSAVATLAMWLGWSSNHWSSSYYLHTNFVPTTVFSNSQTSIQPIVLHVTCSSAKLHFKTPISKNFHQSQKWSCHPYTRNSHDSMVSTTLSVMCTATYSAASLHKRLCGAAPRRGIPWVYSTAAEGRRFEGICEWVDQSFSNCLCDTATERRPY